MTRLRPYLAIIVAVIGGHLAAAADTETDLLKRAQELFQPLPPEIAGTGTPIARARAALGRLLFFDPRLTIDGNVSCSTCHQAGAVRNRRFSGVARVGCATCHNGTLFGGRRYRKFGVYEDYSGAVTPWPGK